MLRPVQIALVGKGYPEYFETKLVDHLRDLSLETGLAINLAYSETLRAAKRLPKSYRRMPFNMLIFWAPMADLPAIIEKRALSCMDAPGVAREKRTRIGGRACSHVSGLFAAVR